MVFTAPFTVGGSPLRLLLFYKLLLSFLGFPHGLAGKESACNEGDLGLIPGLERSPGEGNSYPFQYSGLENSMDCIVQLSDTTERLSLTIIFIADDSMILALNCCYIDFRTNSSV